MNFPTIAKATLAAAFCLLICMGIQSKPKKSSTYTITTADLCRNVRGYAGPVPVAVTFSNNKIISIKALPNAETPAYFRRVEQSGIYKQWIGLTPKQAVAKKVDAVSGATFSSRALIENVRAAARAAMKKK